MLDFSPPKVTKESYAEHLRLRQERVIPSHIYARYPQDKQAQDDKWSLSYTAKLKAAGVPELEATVVHIIYLSLKAKSWTN